MHLLWTVLLLLVFGPVLCLLGVHLFLMYLVAMLPVLLLLTIVRGIVTGLAAGISAGLILRRRLSAQNMRTAVSRPRSPRAPHR